MCDATIAAVVERLVNEKVSDDLSFTAFDITSGVRAELGRGTYVPHADVRDVVSRLYNSGMMCGYIKELGSGYATAVQPMVYKLNFNGNIDSDVADDIADEPTDEETKKTFWSGLKDLLGV